MPHEVVDRGRKFIFCRPRDHKPQGLHVWAKPACFRRIHGGIFLLFRSSGLQVEFERGISGGTFLLLTIPFHLGREREPSAHLRLASAIVIEDALDSPHLRAKVIRVGALLVPNLQWLDCPGALEVEQHDSAISTNRNIC